MSNVEKVIAKIFNEVADGLLTGQMGSIPNIAITGIGSEHGEAEVMAGALRAAKSGINVSYIGSLHEDGVTTVEVENEEACHKKMDELLANKEVDGAVTMHYPFPIGVSTVGRTITPGTGKELFIATTTGTSATDRVTAMVKNAIYGIIAAKACGVKNPTVGIINIDGAQQTYNALKQLKERGYDINFAESKRADGGCIFRGNDILTGAADVVVCDSLTGNVLIKMLASFTTGGSYESVGFGYGPGVGKGYDQIVMIISRASGAPVISGAIQYAADLVRGNFFDISHKEFEKAEKAGFNEILDKIKASNKPAAKADEAEVVAPPKEVVTAQISGIEVMDLEDAVAALWKAGIYAESGMGCTGPIILVPEDKCEKAVEILQKDGWITQ
ncbi:glycine/sarcosine/betaine reductase complex component C subunit alpha [Anaeropeptidivorans aminofermentans]|uniref:glycine/sarcosine/betaine reductase complex component C subunit alpha n=1 Tax=Anaeropeptidivorans aminofermentans TaxID=2934315 RepID=UPI0020254880|nr:glycine/sarcosine/betaine reductase complex component C subunit alpha [Anaeropeptidivorans aminofermentans]